MNEVMNQTLKVLETTAVEQVSQQALAWPHRVRDLIIMDKETFAQANALTTGIQAVRKEIAKVFDPMEAKAKEAKRAAEANRKEIEFQRATVEAPLLEAEEILYPKIDTYVRQQVQLAAAEKLRIQREARKAEEEIRLSAAVEAEQNGDVEIAEQILETPATIPKVHIEVPKAEGLSFREDWSAEVFDYMALLQAVVSKEVSMRYLTDCHGQPLYNSAALNQQARSLREEMRRPGVRAVMKRIPVRG